MPKVKVRYFFPFDRYTGTDVEQVRVAEATVAGLVKTLAGRYGRELTSNLVSSNGEKIKEGCMILVQGKWAEMNSPLEEGAEVVLMLLVEGG